MKNKEETAAEQRQKSMTRDERAFQARDRVAENLHFQNQKDGKHTPFEAAFKKAAEIAEREERKKSK